MFTLHFPLCEIVVCLHRPDHLLQVRFFRLLADDTAIVNFTAVEVGVIGSLLAAVSAALAFLFRQGWAAAIEERDKHILRLEKKLDEVERKLQFYVDHELGIKNDECGE